MPRDNIKIEIKMEGVPSFKQFYRKLINDLRKACGGEVLKN